MVVFFFIPMSYLAIVSFWATTRGAPTPLFNIFDYLPQLVILVLLSGVVGLSIFARKMRKRDAFKKKGDSP